MEINSQTLPLLDKHTKILVNQGKYYLFKINNGNGEYALQVSPGEIYVLTSTGEVIEQTSTIQNLKTSEYVYFNDLEFPPSTNVIRQQKGDL